MGINMDKDQEVMDLANKLLKTGVARSHMNAIDMAKTMIGIDLTPSGKKIDNLNDINRTFPERKPVLVDPLPINIGVDINSENNLEDEVRDVLSQITPDFEEKIDSPLFASEGEVEKELFKIESMQDSNLKAEKEISEELDEVKLYSGAYTHLDISENDISHRLDVIDYSDSDIVKGELDEPNIIEKENSFINSETKDDIEIVVQGIESAPNSFVEDAIKETEVTNLEEYSAKKLLQESAYSEPKIEQEIKKDLNTISANKNLDKTEEFILSNTDDTDITDLF